MQAKFLRGRRKTSHICLNEMSPEFPENSIHRDERTLVLSFNSCVVTTLFSICLPIQFFT